MNWAAWIYIGLLFLGAFLAVIKHGQPRGPWSGPDSLIALFVALLLLQAAGFFQ